VKAIYFFIVNPGAADSGYHFREKARRAVACGSRTVISEGPTIFIVFYQQAVKLGYRESMDLSDVIDGPAAVGAN